jgi:hypothetical protein
MCHIGIGCNPYESSSGINKKITLFVFGCTTLLCGYGIPFSFQDLLEILDFFIEWKTLCFSISMSSLCIILFNN